MPEPSRWWEFERFVRDVLQRTPGVQIPDRVDTLFPSQRRKDQGFDIEAVRDGRPLLIEIKSQMPQTSARLRDMTHQLQESAARYVSAAGLNLRPGLLAVFPGALSLNKRESSLQGDVDIWDGRDLRRRARQLGIRVPDFVATLEGEESTEDRETGRRANPETGADQPWTTRRACL